MPILCALLLVGCTKKPQNPKSTQGSKSTQVQNAHSELDNLRKSITENDCTVGIGFFGYIYSESELLGAAFELLTGTDEVSYALERGMKDVDYTCEIMYN